MRFFLFTLLSASLASAAPTKPFAVGHFGQLDWELRVNHLSADAEPGSVCNHKNEKPGAWCTDADKTQAAKLSGVEDRLIEIMNEPGIQSVTMGYFSFSSSNMAKALCAAAEDKNINVTLYIDQGNKTETQSMLKCSKKVKVVGVGRGPYMQVPDSHLFHMKIFIASTLPELTPLAALPASEQDATADATTYVVSSSGNMSGYGTSLHFDNWLFFSGPASDSLIQSNVCTLTSLKNLDADNKDRRAEFAKRYKACRGDIATKESKDIRFFAVPHNKINPQPYAAYKSMVDNTKTQLLVAIHRLTSTSIWKPWIEAKKRGVSVNVILDDDTLRYGKEDGSPFFDVRIMDVQADRGLRAAQIPTFYMETNAEGKPHLFHSKFFVSDGKSLFQGAGNFSSAALNISGLGNYEQFYEIRVPEVVHAYEAAWHQFQSIATPLREHPVYENRDLTYEEIKSYEKKSDEDAE